MATASLVTNLLWGFVMTVDLMGAAGADSMVDTKQNEGLLVVMD
jgi:hypothetical protein